MLNEQLISYVRSELAKGTQRDVLIRSLLNNGWKTEDINAALAAANGETKVSAPPPMPPPQQESLVTAVEISPVKTMVQNTASGLFIACVFILTLISILGVWKIFSGDVIQKSFMTLGLLAFVAVVVIVAGRFVGDSHTVAMPAPVFRAVRNITLATLIASSSLLALIGILAIWDVITDRDLLLKTLSSLAILAFSSLIIVMVALEREQSQLWKKRGGQMSGGAIIVAVLFIWMMFAFLT